MNQKSDRIDLFKKTILRGARPDVFAQSWQGKKKDRNGKVKQGWSPVCTNKFNRKKCPLSIKNNLSGNCSNCANKEYAQITDDDTWGHLTASTPVQPGATNLKDHLGLFLLLPSYTTADGDVLKNVCLQMAGDFDDHTDPSTGIKRDPKKDVQAFLEVCDVHDLAVHVERSKSGKGYHAWWIFSEAIPAFMARRLFFALLAEAGCLDDDDDLHSSSFDRIFPNQDRLTGKGLGNLIAAPLCGGHMKKGNTLFVDSDNGFEPFPKQAPLLKSLADQIDAGGGKLLISKEDIKRVAKALGVDLTETPPHSIQDQSTNPPTNAGAQSCLDSCAFIQHCRDNQASLVEPLWMDMISNLSRFTDGHELIHDISKGHPGYSVDETNGKIAHLSMSSGPVTCAKIRSDGFSGCPADGCDVKAPAGLAARQRGERIIALIDDIDPDLIEGGSITGALEGVLEEISLTKKEEHQPLLERIKEKVPKAKPAELKKVVNGKQKKRISEAQSRDDLPDYRIQNNCYEKKIVDETGQIHYNQFTNFIITLKSDRWFGDELDPYRLIEGEIKTAGGKITTLRISGKVFANNQKLNEAIGEQGGSECKYWPRDINDIRRATQDTSQALQINAYTRVGFIEPAEDRYFTPSQVITPLGIVKNTDRIIDLTEVEYAKSLDMIRLDKAELKRVCTHIVDDLFDLNSHTVTHTLAGHTFISPFLSKLDHATTTTGERYVLWINGITGASKSFLAARFANFFGDFATGDAANSWTSTPYQIQRVGHYFADCLYLVDDFKLKNIQKRHEQVVQILQNYSDGRGRGRLNSDSSVKRTYIIKGNLLVTGEDVPDNEASTLARMIIVSVNTRQKDLVRGRACIKNQHLYKGVTPAFIQFVISQEGWFDDLVARIDAATDMFYEGVEDIANGARLAHNFAMNKVGFDLFAQFLNNIEVIDRDKCDAMIAEHVDNLFLLRDEHSQSVVSEQANNVFLDTLSDMLHSGRVVLHSSKNKIWRSSELIELEPHELRNVVGFIRDDDDHAYIYPKIALAEIQKVLRDAGNTLGFTIKAIGKQLAEEGILVGCEAGRPSTTVRHNGKIHRVWKIKMSDFGLADLGEREVDDEIPF